MKDGNYLESLKAGTMQWFDLGDVISARHGQANAPTVEEVDRQIRRLDKHLRQRGYGCFDFITTVLWTWLPLPRVYREGWLYYSLLPCAQVVSLERDIDRTADDLPLPQILFRRAPLLRGLGRSRPGSVIACDVGRADGCRRIEGYPDCTVSV